MTYVLDACALIAYLKKEEGQEKVFDIFQKAENETASVYMSIVNLIEVHYGFVDDLGKKRAAIILNKIYNLPLQIIDTLNSHVFSEAVRLKSTYKGKGSISKSPLSLADSIGLAVAINLNGIFVTADGGFLEPEAAEHAPVLWFRHPNQKD
jgi:PIN domain nuclease of toxin-antitoxin system